MMVVIGIGCVMEGWLVMSLGIFGMLFVYFGLLVIDLDGVWVVFCLFMGGWLLLICIMNCIVVIECVVIVFGFSSCDGDVYFCVMLLGVGGLVMLLFFNGECIFDLLLGKGVLVGLDIVNFILVYVYCVVMEGVIYSLKYGYDVFVCVGMQFDCIVFIGGGSNSVVWCQLVVDVFGLLVDVLVQVEGVVFGVVLQVLWVFVWVQGDVILISDIIVCYVIVDFVLFVWLDLVCSDVYVWVYVCFFSYFDVIMLLQCG